AQQAPQVADALQAEGAQRSLFSPVLDGQVLPHDIGPALHQAAGRADVLVSVARDEMAAFPGSAVDDAHHEEGERIFGRPSRQWAEDAAAQGRHAWLARFDIAPTARFGACHCIDLPFVFGTLPAFKGAAMLHGLPEGHGKQLSQQVQRAWIAFIRGDAPGWDPVPQQHLLA
ncbi:MAG TPA: carboxylesterase/lipase family protein, partial [Bordetella sp.]|nr:carboxylesterase/lipase family protein [Bordetella sp.]